MHVYLLSVVVVEFVLEHAQFLAGYNLHSQSVSPLPFHFQAAQSLADVCIYIGVYMQCGVFDAQSVLYHR